MKRKPKVVKLSDATVTALSFADRFGLSGDETRAFADYLEERESGKKDAQEEDDQAEGRAADE